MHVDLTILTKERFNFYSFLREKPTVTTNRRNYNFTYIEKKIVKTLRSTGFPKYFTTKTIGALYIY